MNPADASANSDLDSTLRLGQAAPNATQRRAQQHRNTIYLEDATLLSVDEFPGEQFVMRMHAPKCAAAAQPGSFVHLSCDPTLPMRRPLSIMRTHEDCIEILYKNAGVGLQLLSASKVGDKISVLGPIGQPFKPSSERSNKLLIGGGVGIPPMVFLADQLRRKPGNSQTLAIFGSEIPFPFSTESSNISTPWLDDENNHTMPLLEAWGVTCRLATLAGYDGCFDGYVSDLAKRWLSTLSPSELSITEVFSCGPTPMLKAVATLAEEFNLPCQVSLEEFMACAVGGCAGCAVKIRTADGPAMKRVCVDGPVFEAATVDWAPP